MRLPSKPNFLTLSLWLSFLLAMAASVNHLAWTFGTVERPGFEWLGWVPAVAVDTGLAALAYTIQARRKTKRPVFVLWGGVVFFAAISAGANLYHALSVEAVAVATDAVVWIKAVVLSATLPAMYVFLGEIISGDEAQAIATAEREEQRARAKEERSLHLLEQQAANEAKRLALEEQRPVAIEQPSATGTYCERCSTTFKNRQAYAAHGCNKIRSNGHEPAGEVEHVG
jgi:hypothetical protein